MREEIRATSRVHGLPHLFVTTNPADAHNPVSKFLCGSDIDLDIPYCSPNQKDSVETFERAKLLTANFVAGAHFFDLIVNEFFNTLLGEGRANKEGLFGQVKAHNGVVEAAEVYIYTCWSGFKVVFRPEQSVTN